MAGHEALFHLSDADLVAIGGLSTLVLAAIAVAQIHFSGRQTKALESQVQAVREAAEDELVALRSHVEASIAQSEAVREAARAQMQPIVFAEPILPYTIDDRDLETSTGDVGFCYRLTNEGAGVALNVWHGVEVGGVEHAFGYQGPRVISALRVGEVMPGPPDPIEEGLLAGSDEWRSSLPFSIDGYIQRISKDELPSTLDGEAWTCWVRFRNVFGERFETRKPLHQPATFLRLDADSPTSEPWETQHQ